MTSADVVASLKHYVAIQRGPGPVLRCRRRFGPRQVHGCRPPQGAARSLPVPAQPNDVSGDHPASCDRGQARHMGREWNDRHRGVPAPALRRQAECGARPPQRVLGRAAARWGEDHVLPGQRTPRACPSCRADRPGDAAVATGGSALQEQLEVHLLLPAGVRTQTVLHAERSGRRAILVSAAPSP